MKLSIKGLAIGCGIFAAIGVFWCILMKLIGVGSVPFEFVTQFYLGLISPTIGGLILATVIAFIDGCILGAIFAWIYNKFAE